jgi:hypothetical protein
MYNKNVIVFAIAICLVEIYFKGSSVVLKTVKRNKISTFGEKKIPYNYSPRINLRIKVR